MMILQKINTLLNRIMPLITPTSVVIGILLADYLNSYTFLVPWIFAFMTFQGSLSSKFDSFKRIMMHPFPILVALLILHVVMPLYAWGIGHLAFNGDMYTITGLTLAMMIPTGITSIIWVTIYKGNLALALSIIIVDTFLSPFVVPYSLALFIGEHVEMDVWAMMSGLFGMVVIPSLLGMLLNQLTKGKAAENLSAPLAPFSKVGIGLVVMINSSAIAPYFKNFHLKLIIIAVVVFIIAASGYLISWLVGKLLKWEREEIISLIYTGGMRNISAGAVIAVTYFPSQVAVPVIIGMLFQQILASFYGHLFEKSQNRFNKKMGMIREQM